MMGQRGDDQQLFESEMADVDRVENDRRKAARSAPPIASREEREREAALEFERLASGEDPLEVDPVDPAERLEHATPGLDPRVLGQLRRGEFAVQDEVDLHGLASEDARQRLEEFLLDAAGRGLRCVRVVHGRGRGSPGGVPVIKASLPRWLARGAARPLVLAYATTRANAGATDVLLAGPGAVPRRARRRRRRRRR